MFFKHLYLSVFLFQPMALTEVESRYFCEGINQTLGYDLILELKSNSTHMKFYKHEELGLAYGERELKGFFPEGYQGEVQLLKTIPKKADFNNLEKKLKEKLKNGGKFNNTADEDNRNKKTF